MELFIIRHAQSSNNALAAPQSDRVCDPEVTALGHRQAALLAQYLVSVAPRVSYWGAATPPPPGRGFDLQRIISSPMVRTLQTTRPIAKATGLAPELWLDVHEQGGVYLDHGEPRGRVGYPGIDRASLNACFPGFVAPPELDASGWYRGAHENPPEAQSRAFIVASRLWGLAEAEPHLRVALVTHNAFGHLLLSALLAGGGEVPGFFHHDNTGISLVRLSQGGFASLHFFNSLEHLTGDLIT